MLAMRFQCRNCGSSDGRHSRPRSAIEKYVLPIFLLRPVRCMTCYSRCYLWLFVPLSPRSEAKRPEITRRAAA